MALCTWCGQPSEPDSAFCVACGGDTREASLVGAHPGTVRVLDSPDTGRSTSQRHHSAWAEAGDSTDPFWRWEPDRSQFRLLQLRNAAVVGQSAPTAADRDRQFRYGQTAAGGDALPPLDRHPANPSLSPGPAAPGLAGPATAAAQRFAGPATAAAERFGGPATTAAPWGLAKPAQATCSRRVGGDTGASRGGPGAHGRRRLSPPPADPAGGTSSGRWVAMAAAGLLGVTTVAVLAVHAGTADRSSLARQQTTDAAASASLPSAGQPSASVPQPTVDGLVTIEPDVATAPHEAAVAAVLNRYFSAIDGHAYRAYKQLFSPAARDELSAARFRQGYAMTTDSAATLWSIGVIRPGQVEAVVTFTSYQRARYSPMQASCTAWRISLHLIRSGREYLVDTPPGGEQPSSRSCS